MTKQEHKTQERQPADLDTANAVAAAGNATTAANATAISEMATRRNDDADPSPTIQWHGWPACTSVQ